MKVNARKVVREIGGKVFVFASDTEAEGCFSLYLEQRAGEIRALQFHPTFVFELNGVKIGTYEADATYIDKNEKTHVIDFKGFKRTRSKKTGQLGKPRPRVDRDFPLRRNLMKALFGLEVEIR